VAVLRWTCGLALILLAATGAPGLAASRSSIRVISFNIQFLGSSRDRRNEDLADMLAPYDLVIVQELVAPPFPGAFPDGSDLRPDDEARQFFEAMDAKGFDFVLSEEDTGSGPQNHLNSTATEWFVAFYKPRRVAPADDLPHGFLATDRSDNPDYERVPYAFGFRAGKADMVFISVHLQPGGSSPDESRRAHELSTIFSWIADQSSNEHRLGRHEYRGLRRACECAAE